MDESVTDQLTPPPRQRRRLRRSTRIGLLVAVAVLAGGVAVGILQTTDGRQKVAGATSVATTTPTASSSNGSTSTAPALTQALAEVPSQASETSTLTTAGVHVTVNGKVLPVRAIAQEVRGFEDATVTTDVVTGDRAAVPTIGTESTASTSASPSVGSSDETSTAVASAKAIGRTVVSRAATTALPHAVAVSVLQDLLWQTAQQQGSVVPLATAEAFAQQQMGYYEESTAPTGSSSQESSTPPETVQQKFLSAGAVHTYQEIMTIKNEKTAIGGPSTTTSGEPNTGRTVALATWMKNALATSDVTLSNVDGVSVSQLPTDLPHTF